MVFRHANRSARIFCSTSISPPASRGRLHRSRTRPLSKSAPVPAGSPARFSRSARAASSLLQLVPRAAPLPCDLRALERVAAAAFGQRRKMLRQSLRSLGVEPLPLLDAAGIVPTERAEDVPVAGFVALAQALVTTRRAA